MGAPQVQSAFCQSQIGYVDLNVRNTGVLTDLFINSFKGNVALKQSHLCSVYNRQFQADGRTENVPDDREDHQPRYERNPIDDAAESKGG